jgi:predicted transcriptional regulator
VLTRVDLLECLEDGDATALDIADTVDADECAVSMALLRAFRQGLVSRRGNGGGFGGVYVYQLTRRGAERLAYLRG